MSYRVYVPKTWDGKTSLPIILMLHGAGANENSYMDQADGLLPKLAEQHGYIVVSPFGFTALGAYGNPLRLPAVFGQTDAAAKQRAAVTPPRQRELNLSEQDMLTLRQHPEGEGGGSDMIQMPIGATLEEIERTFILATLKHFEGDKRRAADVLACSLKTLYNKLHAYQRDRNAGMN